MSAPNMMAATVGSGQISRAWLNASLPSEAQIGTDIYLSTLIPTRVLARGSNLSNATGASYYALELTRGMTAKLFRVVNGTDTLLTSLTSQGYFSGQWVRAILTANGNALQGEIYRLDTNQYLNSSGQWQTAQAWALTYTDTDPSAINGTGQAGLATMTPYAGTVYFDDFTVTPLAEGFDGPAQNSLPPGWLQYFSSGSNTFAEVTSPVLTGPNALASTAGSSISAVAWSDSLQVDNVQVGASVYLSTLIPAQVIARGTGLNTATPYYYAVQITRGLTVEIVKVLGDPTKPTVLASLNSQSYFSGNWATTTLDVNGNSLMAQVYRPDTAQYLNSSGQWQTSATWALTTSDTSLAAPGKSAQISMWPSHWAQHFRRMIACRAKFLYVRASSVLNRL